MHVTNTGKRISPIPHVLITLTLFPMRGGICFLHLNLGKIATTVKIMLCDFCGEVIKSCTTSTWFSWDTWSWNPTTMLWRRPWSMGEVQISRNEAQRTHSQLASSQQLEPTHQSFEWHILKVDPSDPKKPPQPMKCPAEMCFPSKPCPNCRFTCKIKYCCCFEPLSFGVIDLLWSNRYIPG